MEIENKLELNLGDASLPRSNDSSSSLWDKIKSIGEEQQLALDKELYPGTGVTQRDIMGMVMGSTSPFKSVSSSKVFELLYGYVKGWRGYNLNISKNVASRILEKVSNKTNVPVGKLANFAKSKNASKAVKENREISLEHGKRFREMRGEKTKIFGGFKGGPKVEKNINTISRQEFDDILREELYGLKIKRQ